MDQSSMTPTSYSWANDMNLNNVTSKQATHVAMDAGISPVKIPDDLQNTFIAKIVDDIMEKRYVFFAEVAETSKWVVEVDSPDYQ